MGKTSRNKKRRLQDTQMQAAAATVADDQDSDSENESEYLKAASIIEHLVLNPSLYHKPAAKPLRAAVHKLISSGVLKGVSGSSSGESSLTIPTPHEKIANALRNGDWDIAIFELNIMRQKQNKPPKIGTLQRWVNFCDGVFSVGTSNSVESGGGILNGLIQALDAILRTADSDSVGFIQSDATATAFIDNRNFNVNKNVNTFTPWISNHIYSAEHEDVVKYLEKEGNHTYDTRLTTMKKLHLLQIIPAAERIPVNRHDQKLWCGEGLKLDPTAHTLGSFQIGNYPPILSITQIACENVPVCKDAKFISNVLTKVECDALIRIAEQSGYDPDEPILKEQQSILAHAFVWIVGQDFISTLWDRVKIHLPKEALGLNRRFRCYRYRPGAIYRPHIDGAWPPSWAPSTMTQEEEQEALEGHQKYIYDSSYGKVLSKSTFLIYLNQDFQGGGTTFYAPSWTEGKLDRRAVIPKTGAALVFPHGATGDAALHEGSEVLNGTKYVIRTEVLYPV
jgi:hypothetical protein